MVVWLYQGSGGTGRKDALIDPIAYLSGARVPVQVIYSYQGGVRSLVWSRAPMTLTATPSRWDTIPLIWTSPGAGADSYVLYRNGTQLYAGPSMAYTDLLLDPATSYSYRLDAIRAGAVVSTLTQVATTPARTLTLAIQSFDYSSVTLKWTDAVVGSITQYRIKRNGLQIALVNAPGTTYVDPGLAYNQTYTYQVEALRSGVVIPPVSNTVSQTLTARPPMQIKRDTFAWDTINMSWTDPAGDAATYTLQRGSTVVSSTITGATRTYSDAGVLLPSSSYTYTLTAKDAAGKTIGTVALPMSTGAKTAPTLTAVAQSWNSIKVDWTETDRRSVTKYQLWRRHTSGTDWANIDDGGTDTTHTDTGLDASTWYRYLVRSFRGTEQILPDYEIDGATGARTTSSGSISGPGSGSYSWTECTTVTLVSSANAQMPVTGYVTAFNLACRGYGDAGRVNPQLDAEYLGVRACDTSSTSYPSLDWTDVGVANKLWGPGGHQVGAQVGGNCDKTQWYANAGGGQQTSIRWGQVNYWYYTNLERDAELRAHPWWDEVLAERDIHIASWVGESGETVKVRITDKNTEELLVSWEAPDA